MVLPELSCYIFFVFEPLYGIIIISFTEDDLRFLIPQDPEYLRLSIRELCVCTYTNIPQYQHINVVLLGSILRGTLCTYSKNYEHSINPTAKEHVRRIEITQTEINISAIYNMNISLLDRPPQYNPTLVVVRR